jgi:DNA-binding MarR family transcriptional regulator
VLQKKGLIRKRRSRKDSRSVYLSLSPTGLELAHACNDMSQKANAGMLEGIDPAEREVAIGFLRKISQRLPVLLEQLSEQQNARPESKD